MTRTADTLRGFDADLIGLQEIDVNAERSGVQNQAWRLGQELGMHSAFAKFLDFKRRTVRTRHTLALYPIQRIEHQCPGNEPRTALAIDLLLPDDTVITAVNIHFDWVRDDGFRFQQAERLHNALSQWNRPFVLTGDFNDQPGSRTIELFRDLATEADKPTTASGTYPANKPEIEIDFIFAGPSEQWEVGPSRVVDEPVTSDHRPVLTTLRLK
ncbi:MAG: endonuclease/exonuclease/phosphatase family protein [Pirellulaceae bacterium]